MVRRTTALVAALALLATGCGGDDEPKIPREEAAELRSALLEAKRRLQPLRCGDLDEDSLPKLEERVAALPEGDVRDSLEQGTEHLRSLIEAECTARDNEPEEPTTTEEQEPTPTEPQQTTPPPETTEPETTQPPETTPPETPPGQDGNNGNGNGNDGGSGGQQPPSGAVRPGKEKRVKQERG